MIATRSGPQVDTVLDTFDPANVSLDDLEAELTRLAAVNEELLAGFGGLKAAETAADQAAPSPAAIDDDDDIAAADAAGVRAENAILHGRIMELESELVELRQQLLDLSTPANISLQGDLDEFTRLQHDLDAERRQLQEEREAWQNQLREVEMNVAKERAELARLRTDLQRQQGEIDRALENTGWDPQLKQKLISFQRRPETKGSRPTLEKPPEPLATVPAPTPAKKTSSGIFRRLFGGGQ